MESARKEMILSGIRELLENQQFCEEFAKCEKVDDAKAVLKNYGVDATVEEIEEIRNDGDQILAEVEDSGEEMDVTQLDEVAGGGFWKTTAWIAGGVIGGVVGGVVVAACPASAPGIYSAAVAYSSAAALSISKKKKKKKK